MSPTASQPSTFKARVFAILEGTDPRDRITRIFQLSIIALVLANVAAMIMETVESFSESYEQAIDIFELVSVLVFSVEYVIRLWACTSSEKYSHPVLGRLRFAATPMALIDLVAILPFYIPFLNDRLDLRFVRAVRILRLLRLLKLARYTQAFHLFGRAISSRKEELLCTLFILFVFLLGTSSLMYVVEHDAQPDKFASIPDSLWWGVITVTTVGYGDVQPVTPVGKILGGIIALMGIVFIALPTAIIVAAFLQEPAKFESCPHCGKLLVPPQSGNAAAHPIRTDASDELQAD